MPCDGTAAITIGASRSAVASDDVGATYGDTLAHRPPSRLPAPRETSAIRRSVPFRTRRRLARWRNMINAPVPIAATMTDGGAPVAHATDGSATVAATEPSETTRDSPTVVKNTA